tara:strand:- start:45 stop:386 length:342 start_codon:yes stop_codon:yes gene_type:complete
MINYYTPNNEVVNRNDVNTQASTERVDIPTREEEQALLAYEEHFRQDELASFVKNAQNRAKLSAVYDFEAELQRREESDLPNPQDHAMNSALSNGFTIDESSDGNTRWNHLNA